MIYSRFSDFFNPEATCVETNGFEGMVVFILNFPTRASRLHEGGDGCRRDRGLCRKGVVVELRPVGARERKLTPIDGEGIRACP